MGWRVGGLAGWAHRHDYWVLAPITDTIRTYLPYIVSVRYLSAQIKKTETIYIDGYLVS